MTRVRSGLIAAALAASVVAVTGTPAMAGDSPSPADSIVGDWKTRAYGVKQTITFDSEGKVYGDSGCNRFMGSYTVAGDTITIGPLASTMKYCEGRMDAESRFLTKVQAAQAFAATDTRLMLFGTGKPLKFRAS